MNDRTKDIDDMIFRLRSLNSVVSILATVTCEGAKNVVFDPETIGDALYSVTHSVDTIIADLEEASKDALTIKVTPQTAQMLGRCLDEERRRANADSDYKAYASLLLADAVGWKYADLFEPTNEEPALSDEELDALGIPIVCIRK